MFKLKHIMIVMLIGLSTDTTSTIYGLAFHPIVYDSGSVINTFNEMNPYINSLYPHYGWLSALIWFPYEVGIVLLFTLTFYYVNRIIRFNRTAIATALLVALSPMFAGSINYISIISHMI